MKKGMYKRLAAIIVVVTMIATVLAGCSQKELDLLSAIMNPEMIYSYEGTASAEMSFHVERSSRSSNYGYYGYYEDYLDTILRVMEKFFDGARVDVSVKVSSDKDLKNVKEELIFTPSLLGGQLKNLTTGFWLEYQNYGKDVFDMYVKMPPIYAALSKSTTDKEYLVVNVLEFIEMAQEEAGIDMGTLVNMPGIVNDVTSIQNLVGEYVIKAAMQMDPDAVYVTDVRPSVDEDGKRGAIYTLKISDDGLKKLLASFINDVDQETIKEFLLDFTEAYIKYTARLAPTSYVYADMIDELEYLKEEIEENFDIYYPVAKAVINEVLNKIDNNSILGKNGITFDIEVDSKGFITACNGIIDLRIDVAGIEKAFDSYPSGVKRIDYTLKLSQKLSRINKSVTVEMPETTPKNSVSFVDLIMSID